ncbi:polyketide cyclase/dehydrase/lipid transport protein [Streptomyces sp. TLI_55]|uniref:SRPBCC family protein n=1 Tax=Streptomyces sp. TLI_55 TaxID=1938861 RepID=UPI000BD4BE89|nr:SRPBCC family protein [Streptomyces sp. TLI_55]SNX62659.1 polyketide cyclase/dehydrase/lipid transport protein [Streptomyces sp. TLI_55]
MRILTATKFAAATAGAVLLATGTAHALNDDKPATTATTIAAGAAAHADDVQIDAGAPVITRDNILIHAPLHTIWKIQTDVENWPTWQPDVDVVVKDTPGRLRPGSVFRWSTEGLNITSTVKQVDHGKRLVWGGPAQGITAIHVWTFTPTADGVLVHTEESWTGDPVTANQATLQTALDNSLRNWVNNLKHQAESQVGK